MPVTSGCWVSSTGFNRRRKMDRMWKRVEGVCMWEILMLGVKPFQGVRNADVIHKLEAGERLGKPTLCPPRLYALMNQMWLYDPAERPSIAAVRDQIQEIMMMENDTGLREAEKVHNNLRKLSWGSQDLQPVRTLTSEASSNGGPVKERNNTLPKTLREERAAEERGEGGSGRARAEDVEELRRRVVEAQLLKQRAQAQEDEAWLQRTEQSMGPLSPPPVSKKAENERLAVREEKKAEPSRFPAFTNGNGTDRQTSSPTASEESVGIPLLPPKIPDGMEIDRSADALYNHVLNVVKAVSVFSKSLPSLEPEEFVQHVKGIGEELRKLLSASEAEGLKLSKPMGDRLSLSEKVLSSDMQKLVEAMKRALHYANTTLDAEYRKWMLSEAHVLAVDSKAYLETADAARHLALRLPFRPRTLSDSHPSPAQPTSPTKAPDSPVVTAL